MNLFRAYSLCADLHRTVALPILSRIGGLRHSGKTNASQNLALTTSFFTTAGILLPVVCTAMLNNITSPILVDQYIAPFYFTQNRAAVRSEMTLLEIKRFVRSAARRCSGRAGRYSVFGVFPPMLRAGALIGWVLGFSDKSCQQWADFSPDQGRDPKQLTTSPAFRYQRSQPVDSCTWFVMFGRFGKQTIDSQTLMGGKSGSLPLFPALGSCSHSKMRNPMQSAFVCLILGATFASSQSAPHADPKARI